MIKLDIGSGQAHGNDGWLGVDPFSPTADLRDSMWAIHLGDDSVDEIFSSHALEHIQKKMIIPTLLEWKRLIKPNGKITIRVPDLEWCCKWFIEHQTTGWDMDIIFGNQNHPGEFHQTGFTKTILLDYIRTVGLKVTKFEELNTHSQKTLSVEVTK